VEAIVHAFAPKYNPEVYQNLAFRKQISKVLHACMDAEFNSVSFPAIGTGESSWPVEVVARFMFNAIFGLSSKNGFNLSHVRIVLFDNTAYKVFKKALEQRCSVFEIQTPSIKAKDGCGVRGLNYGINFSENTESLKRRILRFIEKNGNYAISYNKEIISFLEKCKPVHRCTVSTFIRIINSGGFRSRFDLLSERFATHPKKYIWRRVTNSHKISKLLSLHTPKEKLSKDKKKKRYKLVVKYVVYCVLMVLLRSGRFSQISEDVAGKQKRFQKEVVEMLQTESYIPLLGDISEEIGEKYLSDLTARTPGFGNIKDKTMGTNKHVFATHGSNNFDKYGPIHIVLNEEILKHLDCNMSPMSSIYYYTPSILSNRRPWSTKDDTIQRSQKAEAVFLNHRDLLHVSEEKWKEVLAMDIECSMKLMLGDKVSPDKYSEPHPIIKNPTAHDIIEAYLNTNGHTQIEVHLPSFVPLSFIEKIVIDKPSTTESFLDILSDVPHKGQTLRDIVVLKDTANDVSEHIKQMWYMDHEFTIPEKQNNTDKCVLAQKVLDKEYEKDKQEKKE